MSRVLVERCQLGRRHVQENVMCLNEGVSGG